MLQVWDRVGLFWTCQGGLVPHATELLPTVRPWHGRRRGGEWDRGQGVGVGGGGGTVFAKTSALSLHQECRSPRRQFNQKSEAIIFALVSACHQINLDNRLGWGERSEVVYQAVWPSPRQCHQSTALLYHNRSPLSPGPDRQTWVDLMNATHPLNRMLRLCTNNESIYRYSSVQCCFTCTETVRTIRDGDTQDGHLHFHTAPELWEIYLCVAD